MTATRRSPARDAAAARVRAAIAAAPAERMAQLAAHNRRVLEARARGETLREIGARERRTVWCIALRERQALKALARDPLERMRAEEATS